MHKESRVSDMMAQIIYIYIYLYSPWWQHRHIKNIHANSLKKKKCIYIKSLHKRTEHAKLWQNWKDWVCHRPQHWFKMIQNNQLVH